MKAKAIPLIGIIFTALLVVGVGALQAGEKQRPMKADAKGGKAMQWTFDKEAVGKPPAGAEVFSGNWLVRAEPDAPTPPNVLCQTGYADYPAIALSNRVYGDVTVSTRFKPISGRSDQAAGIIFRIQDKDNYYILRANALEDNVNIYKYVNGRRSLVSESSARAPSGQWQELRVEVKGNVIRGYLNGALVAEGADDTFKAGRVGLWTKADSVTCFDNIVVTAR